MSDRISRPHTSKHVIREEMLLQEGGKVILIKAEGMWFKK